MSGQRFIPLRVVLTLDRETVQWVARCVEYDIVASGRTLLDAQRAFIGVFAAQVIANVSAGRQPLEGVPEAPPEIARRFDEGQPLGERGRALEIPPAMLPPNYMIDAQLEEMRVCA
ncbi:MAG TPA: hypothetical protein VHE30_24790 [Polyangiaceae bacterium]|nr:hypothetical protein [Polyangiaceae bacterium]